MKSKIKPTLKLQLLYVMTGEVTNGKRPHPKTGSPLPLPQSRDGNLKVQRHTQTHTQRQHRTQQCKQNRRRGQTGAATKPKGEPKLKQEKNLK